MSALQLEEKYPNGKRSRVRCHPELGSESRVAVRAILEEGLVC